MRETKNTDKKPVREIAEYEAAFQTLAESVQFLHTEDIPDIDLYMDQVTTFMEQKLASMTRDPENDKILTKTMINNYAKMGLLIPPVKKKYSREHMIYLLMIYYMKNFLTTGDIDKILKPLKEGCAASAAKDGKSGAVKSAKAGAEPLPGEQDAAQEMPPLAQIHDVLSDELAAQIRLETDNTKALFDAAGEAFADVPGECGRELRKLDMICRLSADIYLKKLFIERILDEEA